MIGSTLTDPLLAAARFGADEPGWIGRVVDRHTRRTNGSCAGCGSYRAVAWPCAMVHIARLAKEIQAKRVSTALLDQQRSDLVELPGSAQP